MNQVLKYSVTTEDEKNLIQNKEVGVTAYVTDTKTTYTWTGSAWV